MNRLPAGRFPARTALLAMLALCACGPKAPAVNATAPVTPSTHRGFPIVTGHHALDCSACHGDYTPPIQVDCLGCHTTGPTSAVHTTTQNYLFTSTACLDCHRDPTSHPFDHAGITGCAGCHQAGAFYAALPTPGFTHPATGTRDCSACHVIRSWLNAGAPAGVVSDPAASIAVNALIASYSGTDIAGFTLQLQTLPQGMDHATAEVNMAGLACAACHDGAAAGGYLSGRLHASLGRLARPAPAACRDCHADSVPTGFVGPIATAPVRTPPSGEMKHDAVAWSAGVPTATRVVTADCGACHLPPTAGLAATWATGRAGSAPARYHAALGAAGLAQPASCLDCHANTRQAAVSFDHLAAGATGDCIACHAWPGTGGASAPDWLGATDLPQFIVVGGFAVPQPPASAPTLQAGIANLPHPTLPSGGSCATCHAGGKGAKRAMGYDHLAAPGRANCSACHEAGSDLVAAAWNGATAEAAGAGDTRPHTLASVVAQKGGIGGDRCTVTAPNHFFPVQCQECHAVPGGTGAVTTGAAYARAWYFPHQESRMANPGTCNLCHTGSGCPK